MQIFVRTLTGPVFAIPCQEDDTILTIKQAVEKKYEDGMPPSQQRLIFAGKQLEDERTLEDYKILHNMTIHICLRLRGGMQIFVRTLTGPVFAIPCQEDDTILTIKQAVEKKYEDGMPPSQQRLIFAGKQLEDERTLEDYKILHNMTIHICLRLRGGMQIFVRTLTGPVFAIPCQEDDTILTIKQAVEKKYEDGMPPSQQRLIFAGKQLEDERTLEDYKILHNMTIHICLRLRGGMQIFVRTLTGPVFAIPCQEDDTILTIKQAVEKKYEDGMPPSQQRLIFAGKQLEDERTLEDYKILHNMTIHICLRLRGGMQIFVRTLTGPVFAIPCQEDDTILTIKQAVEKKYEDGMPPSQQRLIFAGKQLEDERTLEDYKILHNMTIHICLRLRGGMQIFVRTLTGPVFAIPCQEDDTILTIKQAVEKKYEDGMPPSQQRLIFAGKQLEDERTLEDYKILHNMTIHICLRLRGGQ